ncbi:DUF3168 domain-containing protein [soil metagenome]
MIDHESALQKGLISRLRADAAITALLGDPARVWDEPEAVPAFPYLLIGRSQSRDVGADGCGVEHTLTLNCVSRFPGVEEVKAIVAAVRARLSDAVVEVDGVRTISLRTSFADVFRSGDGRRAYGVIRVRAVTETV